MALSTVQHTDLLLPKHIFRAYDIRFQLHEINQQTLYALGQSLGTANLKEGIKSIVVARDGRLSGPSLQQALIKGLRSTGTDVTNIGQVPTPVLYFAAKTLATPSGIMLTGSHNPSDFNGLKCVINGKTLTQNSILAVYDRIASNQCITAEQTGSYIEKDITEDYLHTITNDIQPKRALKVVLDAGNGVAGEIAPELFKRLGCELTCLHCEIDGNFPNHHPDPSKPENLQDLIRTVKETGADIGLAFDGDGDRLGVITSKGEVIWPDRQLMFFAQDVLKNHPGATVVYDVKCSANVHKVIEESGGKPLMYKTGHSLMKNKMIEVNAPFAGEMSGHLFFNDRWFGFDDGLYTGARLIELLAQGSEDSDTLFAHIPDSVNTPELNVAIDEEQKFDFVNVLIEKARVQFPEAHIITIDGMRIEFSNGWCLVRASNTAANLVIRFEADSVSDIKEIKDNIRKIIAATSSELIIPF